MKLRLRNIVTKQTLKIQTPDPCTLHNLKLLISNETPDSVFLSLNRKHELFSSNPFTDTLTSLGVTSGDLIFFSVNPSSISTANIEPKSISLESCSRNEGKSVVVEHEAMNRGQTLSGFGVCSDNIAKKGLIVESDSGSLESGRNEGENVIVEPKSDKDEEETLIVESESKENSFLGKYELGTDETLESDTQMEETLISGNQFPQNQILGRNPELGRDGTVGFYSEEGRNKEIIGESVGMEIDGVDDVADDGKGKRFSVPGFLRKVFNKELGDSGGCDHKLVVIAVHAVLKESGFLGFDAVSKKKIDGFYLPDEWPKSGCTLSLCYTLPEIVQMSGVVKTVTLKVKSLGKDVIFYGSLASEGSGIYRVCLDEERLAIVLNLMWANLDTAMEKNGFIIHPEKEVFEFWKTVKDKLALPLLIDLCEMANLPPPSCFTRLPTDLKLLVLELLPGADVAKAACVSQELRFLSSYDDLWEKKFLEQFGNAAVAEGSAVVSSWKRKFVKVWEARKRRRVTDVARGPPVWVPSNYRDPAMFRFPRIIGGDYDMAPGLLRGGGNFGMTPSILRGDENYDMAPSIFPMGGRFSRRQRGRDVMPHCNFGNGHA